MPPHNLTSNPSCPLRKAPFSLPVAPGPSSDSATILQTFRDTLGLAVPTRHYPNQVLRPETVKGITFGSLHSSSFVSRRLPCALSLILK